MVCASSLEYVLLSLYCRGRKANISCTTRTLADIQKRFSNELFDEIIFGEEVRAGAVGVGEVAANGVLASSEVPLATMRERLAELQTVGGMVAGS